MVYMNWVFLEGKLGLKERLDGEKNNEANANFFSLIKARKFTKRLCLKGEGPCPLPVHPWCFVAILSALGRQAVAYSGMSQEDRFSPSRQVAEEQGSCHFKRSQPSQKAALQVAPPQWLQGLH